MIRLVKNADIDVKQWDTTIHLDPQALIYGLSWYLDIVAYGWDALVYDDYKAVMPLTPQLYKRVLPSVIRPYGTQQLGVFSRERVSAELLKAFLKKIPAKYVYKDLCLNAQNPIENIRSGKLIPRTNLLITLIGSNAEKIRARYSKNTKRNLAKAEKYPHQFFYNDAPDVLLRIFQNNKGKELPHLQERHYATLRQIMYVAIHRKTGYLITLYDEYNTAIAGLFFLEYRGRVILLFSATTDYGKETHALTLLIDHVLTQKAGLADVFDFEGSDIPGLRRFYEGFGAQEEIYYNWKKWF
ncbi:hypothetical protein JCM31826_18400 [Thermaurantimonas aggregans]|uniref:BioF2-like acetyltransferase domain-containing protein n=1 Tax=Thermaurantimonas aggregans TaxID=2173829 RepID=A0A401XMX8_9FLAO|nr:hypothetical protein [Thermaurantimonas aggregans]MCX8148132.1 hypothetical protein [Thermaurantimonas aggregans]GCD78358.1 hypothetical protein JCM31826_18400 [Thermaurantimonas aggregans]